MDGYYYLHTNGDLIYKKFLPEVDSPFVRRIWEVFPDDRACAWIILIEAKALGADPLRIEELALRWGINDEDAPKFVERIRDREGNPLVFLDHLEDGGWMAGLYEPGTKERRQQATGDTALEALANNAKIGLLARGF